LDGLGKMDACVRLTQYYNPQASRHIFASTTTGLAPCLGKGWIAAAYARRALSQVMIVRPRCAWCMEACCLFHAWYLAVSSLQSVIPCPTHTHLLALPCLALPTAANAAGCLSAPTRQEECAHASNAWRFTPQQEQLRVSRCQIWLSRPGQARPAISGAMIMSAIR
jgi:hypothetical protein